MKSFPTRVVLDTNVFVSALIFGGVNSLPSKVLYYCLLNCTVFSSKELEKEIKNTLSKPKFGSKIKLDTYTRLEEIYSLLITTDVLSEVNVCRDPKDNFLLALSNDTGTDYLITGDKDLLVLGIYNDVRIVTVSEFVELFLTE